MTDKTNDTDLAKIIILINKEAGIDFSHYKMPTLKRRIARRMLFHQIKTTREYLKLLTEHIDEIHLLYEEMLIHVTEFFRDAETYQYLKEELLPKLLASKAAGTPFRIWIPACATGEEVYSIAINILEILTLASLDTPIKIFATDLSATAIKKARKGEYSRQNLASVSTKRLKHFFTKSGNNYSINKEVRNICVFAQHNVLNDPPFSRVDFISCRNMLIYLDNAAQKKVISTFHYALNSGGYLMLGKSETPGSSTNQFSQVNNKFKVYLRKNISGKKYLPELFKRTHAKTLQPPTILKEPVANKKMPAKWFGKTVDTILLSHLLSRFVSASVVINQNLEILQFKGETDLYLQHPTGKANLNLLKMTRTEITFELRMAVSKAITSGATFRTPDIEIKNGDGYRMVNIEVIPLLSQWDETIFLILFCEPEKIAAPFTGVHDGNIEALKDERIQKLENDLAKAHQNMVVFTRQQDGFTEELQSAHEEVVSSNEELQSLNEELETSKDEIESSIEELITTNQELIGRNQLLLESYEYSETLINTMHEPLLVLDKDLRIRSANTAFYKNFMVKESESVGTLLYELGDKQWAIPSLRKLLKDIVLENTQVYDFELPINFPGIGEKIILLNAGRLIQKSNGGILILLAMYDITERMRLMRGEKENLTKAITQNQLHNEELEILVEERTSAVTHTNKLLEKNMASLEKLNEELQAFAFVSSHDLQEPLRRIQTLSAMILENDYPNISEKGKGHFESIQLAVKRMRALIQDLIAYSEVNETEIGFEKAAITSILHEVLKELEDTILEKKAVIVTDITGTVNLIPFQLRQLFHNLIGNALKFAKPGHPPHISIKSRMMKSCILNTNKQDKVKQSCCHITITDKGIGFDKKYRDRIFTVFQRLHSRDQFEGTGIGLAIVKKIIQNHHGIISARSEVGKGTTFDIYLPE